VYTTFVVYTNVEQSSETPNKIYIFFGKYFFKQKPTTEKMDRKQASTALQNAVAFLKGQKIIKKEIEISPKTGFIDALYTALEQADFVHNHRLTVRSMLGMIKTAAVAIGVHNFEIGKITIKEVMVTLICYRCAEYFYGSLYRIWQMNMLCIFFVVFPYYYNAFRLHIIKKPLI